jgi:hypothetical protein
MPRAIAGRLTYAEPPEPGTIVGPRGLTREWLVVLPADGEPGTPVGYASPDELAAVEAPDHEPRSVAEMRIRRLGVFRAQVTG